METNKYFGIFYLKMGLLLFWTLWFTLAFFSNLFDLLQTYHIFTSISFHSGNWKALASVISIYHMSPLVLSILFYCDLFAEVIILFLLVKSIFYFYRHNNNYWKYVNLAFIFSIGLWCVFIIMEEIFIAYAFEATHIRLCIFEILSLFVFHLLSSESVSIT